MGREINVFNKSIAINEIWNKCVKTITGRRGGQIEFTTESIKLVREGAAAVWLLEKCRLAGKSGWVC